MGKNISFTLPLPPSVNRAYDIKINYIGRRAVPSRFLTNDAVAFKRIATEIILSSARVNKIDILSDNPNDYIRMNMTVFMNRKHRDSDNLLKLTQDAITKSGIILDDCNLLANIENVYIDSKNPRIEIELEVLDKIGIFKDRTHLKEFELKNCHKCKKHFYKKPCGDYKKYISNYTSETIDLEKLKCKNIKILGGK